jgi:uncharacterized membrane protein
LLIRFRFNADLAVAVGLSIAHPFVGYIVPVEALRIAVSLGILLVIPGYLLTVALFPGQDDLQGVERIGFTFGLSFIALSFIGLGLHYTPIGITSLSFLFSVAGFSTLTGLVALYRRSRLAANDQFALHISVRRIQWHGMRWSDRIALISSTLAAVLLGVAVVAVVLIPKTAERFTEFYLISSDGHLSGYSSEIARGQLVTIVLGVVNREHDDVQYRIEVHRDMIREEVANISLNHGETWEQPYTFTLSQQAENQKVEFLLYKRDEEEPYRSLHLWFTVRE